MRLWALFVRRNIYMQFAHLVCVTSANNNKYYDMRELGDGTFDAKYGRIGVTAQTVNYPMSRWNSTYSSKIRKGYKDMTNLSSVTEVTVQTDSGYKPIEDKDVRELIEYLQSKARDTVRKNYLVGSDKVTQSMVDAAQRILNGLSVGSLNSVSDFNDELLRLFAVIPRRMGHVPDYLASSPADFEKIVHREQELLDVMAGQIYTPTIQKTQDGDPSKTILEAYGLKFSPVTDKDVATIKKELGAECAQYYYRAWRVENVETRNKFKAFTKGKGRITKKLYWHGSRTENWWSILRSGLKLRPTNAVINGKMFGYGLYFAPRARKSLGYTSMHGSHWANGSSQFGFMALYEVVYGKPFDVYDRAYSDMTYDKLQRLAPGCSCLHAHAGKVLYNDEVIVYKEEQTTIKYLVELKN